MNSGPVAQSGRTPEPSDGCWCAYSTRLLTLGFPGKDTEASREGIVSHYPAISNLVGPAHVAPGVRMAKRVIIVHQWTSSPSGDWYPWLKLELVKRGVAVDVLPMPNPDAPRMEEWVPFLAEKAGEVNQDTFLVGHSVGCQTILRFLQTLPQGTRVGGIFFVAGWIHL